MLGIHFNFEGQISVGSMYESHGPTLHLDFHSFCQL